MSLLLYVCDVVRFGFLFTDVLGLAWQDDGSVEVSSAAELKASSAYIKSLEKKYGKNIKVCTAVQQQKGLDTLPYREYQQVTHTYLHCLLMPCGTLVASYMLYIIMHHPPRV